MIYCTSSGFYYNPLKDVAEKAMAPQLQYSCLEDPRDGGALWSAVHGVA